ncbi:MAG: hypothetical protein CL764_06630 [Chloroflexi bacterium]|nr:hypothetical protein [Chloroflexota bacterium]|tara:strand:- start:1628 stop:2854 length:1227 start_codon:yes stop_codon:yes gene_type:complete
MDSLEKENNISFYIHIPFCQIKCPYCDFNTYENIENFIPNYMKGINIEINNWEKILVQYNVKSIYFGGGTPSYIKSSYIKEIINLIKSKFSVEKNPEITLEANPVDLNIYKLSSYLDIGINRLSIGIQSFSDSLLKKLGRNHDQKSAIKSIENTLKAGFKNFNIDLMYGIPSQSINQWRESLTKIKNYEINHLSTYNLTFEEGTPFYHWEKQGKLIAPKDKKIEDMYLLQKEFLTEIGFIHYEISNWSKPKMQSKHNLRYWSGNHYIGVGAGAHSYFDNKRFSNIKSPKKYIEKMKPQNINQTNDFFKKISNIGIIHEQETLTQKDIFFDRVMLNLRLIKGIKHQDIYREFNINFPKKFKHLLSELVDLELIEENTEITKLTDKGILLSNEIIMRFFQEISKPLPIKT